MEFQIHVCVSSLCLLFVCVYIFVSEYRRFGVRLDIALICLGFFLQNDSLFTVGIPTDSQE